MLNRVRLPVWRALALAVVFTRGLYAQVPPDTRLAPLRTVTISTTEGTWMALDVSPDGRTIAFDLLGNIFTLPIAGGRARQLTEGPAFHQWPQFSLDGRFLVFTSDQGGYHQLWRMPAAGGAPRLVPLRDTAGYRLAPEINASLSFDTAAAVHRAPGGRYAIRKWSASTPPQGDLRDCVPRDFVLTDWSTGVERVLAPAGADCGSDILPPSAFTPDGRAFITAYGGKLRRIAVPSGETTVIPFRANVRLRIRPLVRFPVRVPEDSLVHARRVSGAALSPDRSQVAFSAFSRIWVSPVPAGPPKRLTALETGEFWPAWSPDGRYVAFATWTDADGGAGAIYRMRADGTGKPERLTTEPGAYTGLTYSSDGTKVLAVMRSLQAARRSELDRTDVERGAEVVWVPVTGGAPRILDSSDWPVASHGIGTLTRLHVLDGPEVRDGDRVARFVSLQQRHLPDGKAHEVAAVVTTSLGSQSDTAVKIVLPGSEPRPWSGISERSINDVVLSPTRKLALVVMDMRKLFLVAVPPKQGTSPPAVVLDPADPQVRLVTPLAGGAEFPRWQRDGRTFTYSFGNTLYIYDVGAAAPRPMKLDVTARRDLPTGTLALRNARLITMRGSEVIERGDLVIRDRRIAALGPSGTVRIPSGAHVVDMSGRTIIPGLVDLHNHVDLMQRLTRSRAWRFATDLAYGVLTSRDPQTYHTAFMSDEDQLATGELLGPRYMNTGPAIGTPANDPITSLDDARQVIARYADVYQVRNLKEYMATRREVRQWVIIAAAERGLNVGSHGNLMLQHLIQNAIDGYAGYDHLRIAVPLYRDVRQLLALTGITLAHANWFPVQLYFVPTLTAAERARMERLYSPEAFANWTFMWPKEFERRADPNWRQHVTLARLVAEGGRVAAGGHGDPPGLGTHMQLWGYAAGGMPALEVLRAGTLRGAEALGMDRDLGSLEVGKLGDVLVLDRNPLEDIRHTTTIRFIVFNGRLRDAETLDELWPQPRATSPPWWVPTSAHSTSRQ